MNKNGTNGKGGQADADKVRWAAVGLGHITQAAFLPSFQNADNAELVALVSGDDEKLAEVGKKYDIEHCLHYDDFERFLEKGLVDAVYIGLPNHLHCEYTLAAARAGVHVLCEKPMAVTEEECEAMIAACDDAGVKLMIAYRLHFERANLEVVDLLRDGEIGEVRLFDSVFSQDVEAGDIRLSPIEKGGGTVYDIGIYAINAARYLFGDEPTRVFAASESRESDPRFEHCDEMTHATLTFPGHRLASFTTNFGAASVSMYRVVGTEGEVRVEPAYDYATHLSYQVVKDGTVVREKTFDKRDQFGAELFYFSNCILNDEPPEPGGKEGLADVRIIRATYESAAQNAPVDLEPVEVGARPTLSQVVDRPGFPKPEEVKASSPTR